MPRYVALLRAVNVTGHQIIKMEDLRTMFSAMKLKNVSTYIQSGNVLFDSPETDETKLHKSVHRQLTKALGYEVELFLRTMEELETIIKQNPLKNVTLPGTTMTYVTFLAGEPDKTKAKTLEAISNPLEAVKVKNREVYYMCRKDTTEKMKFTNKITDKLLGMPGTMRNWNTIVKLASMK